MNSLLIIAALGIGYAIYQNEKTRQYFENELRETAENINTDIDNRLNENTLTPESVTNSIEVKEVMLGLSSVSDKYMNCAAGVVWKNNSDHDIKIVVDEATFSVGGYRMRVGADNLTAITIPKRSTNYQKLFDYENTTLWDSLTARKQVRYVIGEAQGHPGKEAKAIWGKANFDAEFYCTFTPISSLTEKKGDQGIIDGADAIGRYYGSTALAWQLVNWVRTYIWK